MANNYFRRGGDAAIAANRKGKLRLKAGGDRGGAAQRTGGPFLGRTTTAGKNVKRETPSERRISETEKNHERKGDYG